MQGKLLRLFEPRWTPSYGRFDLCRGCGSYITYCRRFWEKQLWKIVSWIWYAHKTTAIFNRKVTF